MIRRRFLAFLILVLAVAMTASAQSSKKVGKGKGVGGRVTAYTIVSGDGSFLGIFTDDVTSENARSYKLKEERGVIVADVVEDSPAEKAGLKKGDVILEFNGEKLEGKVQLNRLINETPPGRTVDLLISRDGSAQHIKATLADRSERLWVERGSRDLEGRAAEQAERQSERAEQQRERQRERAERMREQSESMRDKLERADGYNYGYAFAGARRRLGIQTMPLTKQLSEYFGVSQGRGLLVTVVEKDSAAEKAGLKAGDVIVDVDGRSIEDSSGLIEAMNRKDEGPINLKVVRNKSEMQIQATPEDRKEKTEGQYYPVRPFRIFPRGFLRVEPNLWLGTDLGFDGFEFEMPEIVIPPIPPIPPVPHVPHFRLMTDVPSVRIAPVRPLNLRIDAKEMRTSRVM